jgi:methionyl-tRNA synthetase
VVRYNDGVVPRPGRLDSADHRLRAAADALPGQVACAFDHIALDRAADAVLRFVTAANQYADETAPWQRTKACDHDRVATILYHLIEAARLAAWHLTPFVPESATQAHRRLSGHDPNPGLGTFGAVEPGARVTVGSPLFPRVGDGQASSASARPPASQRKPIRFQAPAPAEPLTGGG